MENKLKSAAAQTACLTKGYATVCITLDPCQVPPSLLRKILSISADKVGSGDVSLASNLMIIANVKFTGRAGRVPPDVLLLKNPSVLKRARAGGTGV